MKDVMKITAILMLSALSGIAQSDQQAGLEIAQRVDAADSGWKDEQLMAVMTLRGSNGKEVSRIIRTKILEQADDGDLSLTIFDRPNDVKGTVFLSHSHKMGDDDQWLFLPALRRVKRISSNNRSGPFMGSEFAFEDITSEEVERYSYNFLREDSCADSLDCYVYERFPEDKNSGYSKQIVYADKEHLRVHRIEYFDRKQAHQKTLERKGYQKFGDFWRAKKWTMVNHLRNKVTIINWQERVFDSGLMESDFDKNAIKRYK